MKYALALCALVAACNSAAAKPHIDESVRPSAPLSALDAPALYARSCAPCHGDDAKGYKADHAPSLVNPTFLQSATDEFLRRSIADGRPGTSMAAYGHGMGGPLDDAQIDKLVAWLRARGPAAEALSPAGAGDAARGAAVYAQNCVKCHGTASTRGDAAQLANPRFLEAASDAFVRHAIVVGRPGTPMEAWAGKLDDTQIDDLVAYVRAFAKPVEEHQLPPPTGHEPLVLNPGSRDPSFSLHPEPCASGSGAKPCNPDPRYVSAAEVKRALDEHRKVVIIDARPESDWRRVHVPGAVSIPYVDMHRLGEIPSDVWVVAYCACPHHLSGIVVDELRKRGHTRSAVLDEGILEWHRRGYPVVHAEGVMPPPAEAPHRPPQ